MTSQDNLLARVEKLERQNRRMKLIGLGSLIVAGAILLMGQAKQPTVLNEVSAKSFTLLDSRGKARARLEMRAPEPGLAWDESIDAKGNPVYTNRAATLATPALVLFDYDGAERLLLNLSSLDGPELLLSGGAGEKSRILLNLAADGPSIALDDGSGSRTQIGVSDVTPWGEVRTTSAASITLFGKNKTVLWSAP